MDNKTRGNLDMEAIKNIKVKILVLLFVVFCFSLNAQVRPDQFTPQPTITDSMAVYGQEGASPEKYYYIDQNTYFQAKSRAELADSTAVLRSEITNVSTGNVKKISTTSVFASTTTTEGDIYLTDGFATVGDNGGANYIIEASGTADNMRIFATSNGKFARLIPNKDGSITPLQLGAILDDGTDDKANIQTALTNFDWVKCHAVGKLLISDSLIIKSNQFIDFGNSIEIEASTLTKTYNLLTTLGSTSSGFPRTENVRVSGGVWDYNGTAKTGGGATQMHQYGFIFHRVDDLTVENVRVEDCIKFAISAADLNHAIFRNIHFETESDGLHVMGPGNNITVDHITGFTGDDFIAFSGSDYTANQYGVLGDINNITITNVFPDSAGTDGSIIALFPGNDGTGLSTDNNYTFRNITIDNVKATSNNADIISIDQYGAAGSATTGGAFKGKINGLNITNISGAAGSEYIVSTSLDTITNAVIDGVFPDDETNKIIINSGYFDRLVLSNLNFQGNNQSPIIEIDDASDIRDLVIDKMKATLTGGTRFIQLESDSVNQRVTFRDCNFKKSPVDAAGSIWINSDSINININNCYFEGMVYANQVNSQGVKIFINDSYFKNTARIVADQIASATVEVYPTSYVFDYDGLDGRYAFDEVNAGTITLMHSSDNVGGYISVSSNYTIPVNYPTGTWKYIYNSSSSPITVQASAGLINGLASITLGDLAGGWFKKTTSSNWNYSSNNSLGSGTAGQTIYNDGSAWIASDNIYNNGGNIGIGTTTPLTQKLNVNGATATTGVTKYSTGEVFINSDASVGNLLQSWTSLGSANRLDVGTSSTFKTWWRSTGFIGIGKSSPLERLELDGTIYVNAEDEGVIVDAGSLRRVGLMKYTGLTPVFIHANTVPMIFGQMNQAHITSGTFTEQMKIETTGNVVIAGQTITIATTKTPSSASDTGTTGMIAWDSNYIYICTATDTWKRVAISTW